MATAMDFDWLVISLERTPDRLEQFRAINAHLGPLIGTLPAVDGQQLDRGELVRAGLLVEGTEWSAGALGVSLSHRLCWLRAIESGRPVCVFEDDVVLRHDFLEQALGTIDALPLDWDVVLFGYNTDSVLDVEILPGCNVRGTFSPGTPTLDDCERFALTSGSVVAMRLHNAFGSCSYAVSPAGAQRLMEGCFPLRRPRAYVPTLKFVVTLESPDTLMNELYRDIGAYVCVPPIVMPINDKQVSTVWKT